jgi:hypothetical protein
LPDDIEPFPYWLLLGLVNLGGGDAQNYVIVPVGDGDFLLQDDNVGVLNDLDNNELVELGDVEEEENQVHSEVVHILS